MERTYVCNREENDLRSIVEVLRAAKGFSFDKAEYYPEGSLYRKLRERFDQALYRATESLLKEKGLQEQVVRPLLNAMSIEKDEIINYTYLNLYSYRLKKGVGQGRLRLDVWLSSNTDFYPALRLHLLHHVSVDRLRKHNNEMKRLVYADGDTDAVDSIPAHEDAYQQCVRNMEVAGAKKRALALLDEIHNTLTRPLQLLIYLRILRNDYDAKSFSEEIMSSNASMDDLIKREYDALRDEMALDFSRYWKIHYKNNALDRLRRTDDINAVRKRLHQQSSIARLTVRKAALVSEYEKECLAGENFTACRAR